METQETTRRQTLELYLLGETEKNNEPRAKRYQR